MSNRKHQQPEPVTSAEPGTNGLVRWLQDPVGAIVASSVAIIGSFGIVLSGTWFIHLALN